MIIKPSLRMELWLLVKRYWWVLVILLLIILLGGGTKYGYDYHQEIVSEKEEKIEESKKIQERLKDELIDIRKQKKEVQELVNTIEYENINLNAKLRRKERELRSRRRDTSYINNAMQIANSVDRFYKQQDSIR